MKDRKINIPKLKMRLPRFLSFRIPIGGGIYLGGGKLILGSMSVVAIGFIASMFVLISSGEQQITFPDTGAVYNAPGHIGTRIVDEEFPADRSQTLQINMPAGIRMDVVKFENISLGKAGLTDAFQLSGTSTTDVITIDELIIRNSEFPTMDWANGDIYSIVATTSVVVAGHTFSPTMASTTNDVVIGSGRGATSYEAKDMVVDRILLIQTTTGGDVIIDKLILDGVRAWTGAFNADYFEIGTLTLENVRIGDDLIINNTVKVNSVLDSVVEEPVFIR